MKSKKFFFFDIQRIFLVIQRHFFEFQTLFVELAKSRKYQGVFEVKKLLSLKFEIPRK